jgi:V/A-type H+-transporting ATPase subunit D
MTHPTRTDLLQLREKLVSVANSVAILKGRRQALIRAFLDSVRPFLHSREAIRREYARALGELRLAEGHEGVALVETLAATSERDLGVDIADKAVMGVRYRELTVWGPVVRSPDERNYGYAATTPHLEEAVYLFERVAEALLGVAVFESKLKRLGEEIQHVTRRTRVLEERVLPKLRTEIKAITHYIGEREREAHFRLKKFKASRSARSGGRPSPGRPHDRRVCSDSSARLSRASASSATSASAGLAPTMPSAASGAIAATTLDEGPDS